MILAHNAILKAISKKKILIEPFDESLVSVNSVDIRLGDKCWVLKHPFSKTDYSEGVRDLYIDQREYWEECLPLIASDVRKKYPVWEGKGIHDDSKVFVFMPGKFYLATTYEKIGTTPGSRLVPEMKSKSTFGRNGLSTALCAGLGDIGYASKWALEVRIVNDTGPIPVAVATPIGQVVFHKTTKDKAYYNGDSRYQNAEGVRFLPKALPLPVF
jgi:dCTP deaminase